MIKKKFSNFLKDDFTKHSFIMFIAIGITGICNLAFHLFMVRTLEPVNYGILNSLIALLMFITYPVGSFYRVSTKFQSEYFSLEEINKTKQFIMHWGKRLVIFASILLVLISIFRVPFSNFMQVENSSLITLIGVIAFFYLMFPVFYGMLAGYQAFGIFGLTLSLNSIGRLIASIIVVLLGFGLIGIFISWIGVKILALILVLCFVSKIITGKHLPNIFKLSLFSLSLEDIKPGEFKRMYKYFVPAAGLSLILAGVMGLDMILVKHFFTPQKAGFYSIAQMVGKIILFLPTPFSLVLFSKSSAKFTKGDKILPVLKKAFFSTMLICGLVAIVTMIFPGEIIELISGQEYLQCIPLVRLFVMAMLFFALSFLMFNYNLAIERFTCLIFSSFFLLLEAILIFFFHSSLVLVLWIVNLTAFLTFITTFIYTFRKSPKSKA